MPNITPRYELATFAWKSINYHFFKTTWMAIITRKFVSTLRAVPITRIMSSFQFNIAKQSIVKKIQIFLNEKLFQRGLRETRNIENCH